MFGWLVNLLSWMVGLWSSLPESTKERIVDLIVEGFEQIFKAFYQTHKNEGVKSNG